MIEPMTTERAYEVLGLAPGATLKEMAFSFRALKEKYDPELHPGHGKEFAEVIAAFELLQFQSSSK